jgi:hypothetical protein
MVVLWEKGDAVNQYKVWRGEASEPEVFSAVNRGAPEFLSPMFEPVKIGDKRELVQVAEQFEPIFLLKHSGNTVADVLSDVANLDEINKAMSLATKDRKNAVSTRKIREKDMARLDQDLVKYKGLDGVVQRGIEVEARYGAIEVAQNKLLELDRYRSVLGKVLLSVQALSDATKPPVPDASKVREAASRAADSDRFLQKLRSMAPEVRRLKNIGQVRDVESKPLREAYTRLAQLDGWVQRLRSFKKNSSEIEMVRQKIVPDKKFVEEALVRLKKVDSLLRRHTSVQEEISRLGAELKTTLEREQAIVQEFRDMGVCPACSQPVTADHCLNLGG